MHRERPEKKLSIIIPCFNEQKTLRGCVENIQAISDERLTLELIIVDDCSTDDSFDIAASLAKEMGNILVLRHEKNMGKGAALRTGISRASGDYVAIQDADLEYDPNDLKRLIVPLMREEAEVVIGSRFLSSGAHRVLYYWHSVGNKFLTFMSNMFTDLNLTDMESCYKVFRREIIQKIEIEENRFGFEPEVVAKIAQLRVRIIEMGISYNARTYEEGKKIGVKDGFRALYCIVKYNARKAPLPIQLAIHLFIGGVSALVNIVFFLLLLTDGAAVAFAAPAAFLAAAAAYNFLRMAVLFQHGVKWGSRAAILISCGLLGALAFIDYLLTVFFLKIGSPPLIAKAAASLMVLILNFLGRGVIVFLRKEKRSVPSGGQTGALRVIELLGKISKAVPVFFLYLAVSVALQLFNGTYGNEFGAHPDEAGHYVTGIMLRDYLFSGQFFSPLAFAENFYLHYPKVAFGHWPPVFYLIQSIWAVFFSISRASMLLLMASLSALLANCVYRQIRKDHPPALAVTVGLVLILLPLVQHFSGMLMAEIPLALFVFSATVAWGAYLESGQRKHSVLFGVLAAAAIMTKGNGFALGFLPVFSVFLGRNVGMMKKASFWLPLPIVLLLCGPFSWLTMDMVKNGWSGQSLSPAYPRLAAPYYLTGLADVFGLFFLLLIIAGWGYRYLSPAITGRVPGRWAAYCALPISVLLFHCLVPSGLDLRHMIPAFPVLLLFFAAGVVWCCDRLSFIRLVAADKRFSILLAAVLAVSLVNAADSPVATWSGFGAVAKDLLRISGRSEAAFLLSSDTRGDGMFVAEVARRDRRPGHYALRASNVLASSRWDGAEHQLRFSDSAGVHAYLQEVPVSFIILDKSLPEKERPKEFLQLQKVLETYPEAYRLHGKYPIVRNGIKTEQAAWVYRSANPFCGLRPVKIEIDMQDMLDRNLGN